MILKEISPGSFINFDTVTNIKFDGYYDADEGANFTRVTIEFLDGGCLRPTLSTNQLHEFYDMLQDM